MSKAESESVRHRTISPGFNKRPITGLPAAPTSAVTLNADMDDVTLDVSFGPRLCEK
jgi:hypothetical protein